MKWSSVCEIAESSLGGKYLTLRPVNFCYPRSSDLDLTEFDLQRIVFDLDGDLAGLVNYCLKAGFNKLVIGVDVLPNQSFLFEEMLHQFPDLRTDRCGCYCHNNTSLTINNITVNDNFAGRSAAPGDPQNIAHLCS